MKNGGHETQWFCGGEESGHTVTILSKDPS